MLVTKRVWSLGKEKVVSNMFPYDLPSGTIHYVMWYTWKTEDSEITSDIANALVKMQISFGRKSKTNRVLRLVCLSVIMILRSIYSHINLILVSDIHRHHIQIRSIRVRETRMELTTWYCDSGWTLSPSSTREVRTLRRYNATFEPVTSFVSDHSIFRTVSRFRHAYKFIIFVVEMFNAPVCWCPTAKRGHVQLVK